MTRLLGIIALCASASAAEAQVPASRQVRDVGGMSELKAMMLKYVARCALDAGQSLAATSDGGAPASSFPGLIGLAPEWRAGACAEDCQQRVSACLLAFVNRTGKHVQVSLTSAAASMVAKLGPNGDDRPFPNQEGAFFGNVWTGKTFSCRGAGAGKGPQVKRFCAIDPASCSSNLATFVDAGRCDDACEMRCFAIGGGERRCAAISCRDPGGGVWRHPITTLLRSAIEAVNADRAADATITDDGVRAESADARVTYEAIDFGAAARPERRLVATFADAKPGAEVEVWLADAHKLGAARTSRPVAGVERVGIPLRTAGIVGAQTLVLRLRGGRALGQLTEIELR